MPKTRRRTVYIRRFFIFMLAAACALPLAAQQGARNYPIQPIPFTAVQFKDRFWAPRLETNQKVTLNYTFGQCAATGRIKNFEIAGGSASGAFCGAYAFDDSDVYKIIEGAAYSLAVQRNPSLERYVDSLILKIGAAQESDGYLYTWRTIYEKEKAAGVVKDATKGQFHRGSDQRWQREDQHSHELYNLGHLYEAAVAWYQATGKRNLLDISLKSAELVWQNFGWDKLRKATGHQEIELGLVKLYLTTGDRRWLDMARFFLDVRGYGEEYMQNHKKVTEQREVVGHAVRACYMYAAMADVSALSGDSAYLPALDAIWNDMTGRKMYVTGGIGSSGSNEGFTKPYDLPNYSAYCETCSSIAFIFWNHRMFLLSGDSKYLDVLERTLYNAAAAGTALSGDRFFYPNPLESRKNVERSPWFTCACCPSNVARFMPSIPGYAYAKKGNEVYVNLFVNSVVNLQNANSKGQKVNVQIAQETNYPWEGKTVLTVNPSVPHTMTLKIRVPGWARGDAVPLDLYSFKNDAPSVITVKVNGKITREAIKGNFIVLQRKWLKGDAVEVSFSMPVRQVKALRDVADDQGKFVIQRGPLVYCLEGKDQPDDRVLNLLIDAPEPAFTPVFEPGLLGGVTTLAFKGDLLLDERQRRTLDLKAIPYYAWANRGKDNMVVWLPQELSAARPLSGASLAVRSATSASENVEGLSAVNDQILPKTTTRDDNTPCARWSPGKTHWVQYDFPQAAEVGTARVYWRNDETIAAPQSFKVLYKEGDQWKPAYSYEGFVVAKEGWSETQFEPVRTTALRLEFVGQEGAPTALYEWELR